MLSPMVEKLPPGLYESLLTLGLRDAVEQLQRDGWSADLGQNGYAVPMTYRTKAGKQFVVIATGAATGAKLVAFALP